MNFEAMNDQCPFEIAQSGIIELTGARVNKKTGGIGIESDNAITYATRVQGDDAKIGETYDGEKGYAAYRNEAWTPIEEALTYIEGGGASFATAQGRIAINLVMSWLRKNYSTIHTIITPPDLYAGTRKLLDMNSAQTSYIDCTLENLEQAVEKNKRCEKHVIFSEPLTNPQMQVSNLSLIMDFVKQQKEKGRHIFTIADNTATPLLISPLSYGFDISVLSMTKYISGHNDLVGGAIVVNKNRMEIAQELQLERDVHGGGLSPEVAVKVSTYVQDFPLRFKQQCRNAFTLASYLATRRVAR